METLPSGKICSVLCMISASSEAMIEEIRGIILKHCSAFIGKRLTIYTLSSGDSLKGSDQSEFRLMLILPSI